MNKRIAFLEQTTQAGTADAFAFYALALEYQKEERLDDALRTFGTLRARDPGYLPMYLMAGQMLLDASRPEDAKGWLEAGAILARERGDHKALGELESALEQARG